MTTWIRWSVCALVLALGLGSAQAQSVTTREDELLSRINWERARSGALPLRFSLVLSQVAQQQAQETAGGVRRLRSPSSQTVAERLRRVGYNAHDWREDILLSEAPPEAVLASLGRRASSRVALDWRFRDIGVGTAEVGGATLYVFLFGWHQGDYFAEATRGLRDRARVAAEMLSRVNDARRQAGLAPLAANPLLDQISRQHAEDMLARSYFSHRTPEGKGPSDRAWDGGYRSGVGEILVEQRFSPKEALDAWLNSPGHRKIILDPNCRELGLGLAIGAGYDAAPGGYRVIWVQSCGLGS